MARYRDEVVALGPLHGRGGKGTGICALFSGSPGTGKTLAARVVADALGINLLQVELSSVVSKYVGESEKKLESLFNEAEAMNAVLFFDEADALFGARSSIKGSNDRYANQEIAYLLQRMEIFDGITILATNLRGNLDPAFARRLQFIINFPDPDVDTRARLWQHHLDVADVDPDDPIDVQELALAAELAGGDIRNVVLAAAYDAVAAGARVGRRQVATALSRELVKLGRRSPMVEALVAATLVQAASNAYARKAPEIEEAHDRFAGSPAFTHNHQRAGGRGAPVGTGPGACSTHAHARFASRCGQRSCRSGRGPSSRLRAAAAQRIGRPERCRERRCPSTFGGV